MSFNTMVKQLALLLLLGTFAATGAVVLAADRPTTNAEPATKAALATTPVAPVVPLAADSRLPKELQPFQGRWKLERCVSNVPGFGAEPQEVQKWRWTVLGEVITWSRQGEEWSIRLTVDPTRKPMEIDLTYLSGPYKDEKCLGMFEWGGTDGKTLCISIQDPGTNGPRPKDLWRTESSKNALIFLRKTESVDPEKELAALQGTWTFRLAQTEAWPIPIGKGPDQTGQGSERRWVVKGNEIAWTGPDGNEIKLAFTIDPHKAPRRIDVTFLNGPHKGKQCRGVYEWGGVDGKQLSLCMTDPDSKAPRPKDISFETAGGRSMIVLAP
jgi:uncharacterized protein (TIGR03067 family)